MTGGYYQLEKEVKPSGKSKILRLISVFSKLLRTLNFFTSDVTMFFF